MHSHRARSNPPRATSDARRTRPTLESAVALAAVPQTAVGRPTHRRPLLTLARRREKPRPSARRKRGAKQKAQLLYEDLLSAIRTRPELELFNKQKARESARMILRYGRNAYDAAQTAQSPNRQHVTADVRKAKGFRSLSCIYDLRDGPPSPKRGRISQTIDVSDVRAPLKISKYTAPLPTIGNAMQPTKGMANEVS